MGGRSPETCGCCDTLARQEGGSQIPDGELGADKLGEDHLNKATSNSGEIAVVPLVQSFEKSQLHAYMRKELKEPFVEFFDIHNLGKEDVQRARKGGA